MENKIEIYKSNINTKSFITWLERKLAPWLKKPLKTSFLFFPLFSFFDNDDGLFTTLFWGGVWGSGGGSDKDEEDDESMNGERSAIGQRTFISPSPRNKNKKWRNEDELEKFARYNHQKLRIKIINRHWGYLILKTIRDIII